MTQLLLCRGCQFLIMNLDNLPALCRAEDIKGSHTEIDMWTGHTFTHYGFRPTVATMRSEHGPCGPDRLLYRPTRWRRLMAVLKGTR